MQISEIYLKNFRNYNQLSLKPNPGINILYGKNGEGKTSIVEAIYMCACARSHKTSKDNEIIKHDKNHYSINLKYYSSLNDEINYDFERSLGINYGSVNSTPNQRILYKDESKLNKISDFVGNFHAVIFAPEDLQLIKDGPSIRRRFLDLLLSQIKKSYFSNLQNYSKILNHRNQLLKNFQDNNKYTLNEYEIVQLDIWDEELCKYAVEIIDERISLLDLIKDYSRSIHKHISGNAEYLTFKYKTNTKITDKLSKEEMFNKIFSQLKGKRIKDIASGYTSVGPHRDDFEILMNDFSLRNFGSQGQQRTAVLALKIAELNILKDITNESPILLLDDVMSELDENRRGKLLDSLTNTQIFITTTDPDNLDKDSLKNLSKSDITYFEIKSGTATQITI